MSEESILQSLETLTNVSDNFLNALKIFITEQNGQRECVLFKNNVLRRISNDAHSFEINDFENFSFSENETIDYFDIYKNIIFEYNVNFKLSIYTIEISILSDANESFNGDSNINELEYNIELICDNTYEYKNLSGNITHNILDKEQMTNDKVELGFLILNSCMNNDFFDSYELFADSDELISDS